MCSYVAQTLCLWCALETRTLEEWRRTNVGRVARRHRLLEFDAEVCMRGKMRWARSGLHWSDPPTSTLPGGSYTTGTPASTSRDFRRNLSGDEYQRCQGVSGAAGDTPTLWGEETYARSHDAACVILLLLLFFCLSNKAFDKMCVHVTTSKRLIEYILWQLLEKRLRASRWKNS